MRFAAAHSLRQVKSSFARVARKPLKTAFDQAPEPIGKVIAPKEFRAFLQKVIKILQLGNLVARTAVGHDRAGGAKLLYGPDWHEIAQNNLGPVDIQRVAIIELAR